MRCCDGQDAHTTHEHRTGELGCSGSDLGRCAGAGGGSCGGDVPGIGGMGRGDDYLWAGLKGTPNHPDRLLVGGLLGPRRGGVGRTMGRAPVESRGDREGRRRLGFLFVIFFGACDM